MFPLIALKSVIYWELTLSSIQMSVKKSVRLAGNLVKMVFFVEIEKNGQNVLYIYYDDSMYERRIRFTIMHEIGHIILEHTEHSDLAESEADFFARYALAPPPLIHKYKPEDYYELANIFQVSLECAMYAMRAYHMWLRYGPSDYLDYEIVLLDLFARIHT